MVRTQWSLALEELGRQITLIQRRVEATVSFRHSSQKVAVAPLDRKLAMTIAGIQNQEEAERVDLAVEPVPLGAYRLILLVPQYKVRVMPVELGSAVVLGVPEEAGALVAAAHALDLRVHPYTFRADALPGPPNGAPGFGLVLSRSVLPVGRLTGQQ